jgi:hypothetical protein
MKWYPLPNRRERQEWGIVKQQHNQTQTVKQQEWESARAQTPTATTLALPLPRTCRPTTIQAIMSLTKDRMMSPQLQTWRHDMAPECEKDSALKNLAATTIAIR